MVYVGGNNSLCWWYLSFSCINRVLVFCLQAYLLIEEDIQDLSHSDEYKYDLHGNHLHVRLHNAPWESNTCMCLFRDCPDVRMDELKPFSVPVWMVEKMKRAMEAQRDQEP